MTEQGREFSVRLDLRADTRETAQRPLQPFEGAVRLSSANRGTRGRQTDVARTALPEFTRAVVSYRVQGFQGVTPYVRWGNYAILVIAAVMTGAAFVIHGSRTRT